MWGEYHYFSEAPNESSASISIDSPGDGVECTARGAAVSIKALRAFFLSGRFYLASAVRLVRIDPRADERRRSGRTEEHLEALCDVEACDTLVERARAIVYPKSPTASWRMGRAFVNMESWKR